MYTYLKFVIAYGKAHTYLFYVCCEELRRYFNNIIDRSLIFLVIRQKWRSQSLFGEEMAKKWRSQSRFGEKESLFGEIESRFGEENGEVNRALAKKMAKSIALWRRNGEEMANSIALYWGFKGDTPL